MRRVPVLPGIRFFIPRSSTLARPLLPVTSRLGITAPAVSSPSRSWRMFSYSPLRRSHSPQPKSNENTENPNSSRSSSPEPNPSLSQRLKTLIKSYGWYALGVYLVLSALDFGVAFAAINIIGAAQVSRVTDYIKGSIHSMLHSLPPEPGSQEYETTPPSGAAGGRESLYAMIVLAYTVHKTLFLPVRVGLTAALTPKLVGWLTQRGWAGREGALRAASKMRERVRNRKENERD
ncbi:peptide alpha-n-acetyltransferase [Pyrrhoderma noxium]|uniref:Peptide alpha-n-acetyltransferase n=1 Tax=Pyrrhoderma noxium TaxID=2282107 RepID=A0A286UGK6_9AGAM|nr:peptide alpha-n-acetyltransferase [Pyrrhoderma noxium]